MGKARTFSDEGEEANYRKEFDDEVYNSTQQNSYNIGSTTFSDQSGIGNFLQSGSDQRKANLTGALFRGNIGFVLQSAVLDDTTNTINILEDQSGDPVSDVSTDRIVIISGFAITADLELILGAQRPGQRLVLYNTDGNTITIKDAATATSPTDPDLIHTPGGLDYILSGFDSVQLIFDSIESQWRVIGAVGTGGGSGYTLIQDEGLSLTQRTTMNFIGTAVTAVDNPGDSRTDITINTGTGTIPSGSAENQHLEWDNAGLSWTVVDFLTMGDTGPFASDGLIRFANDQIMLSSRNVADDGDIEIKVTSSDKFIFDFDGAVPLEISSDEIDVKTVDIVNIDRAKFVQNSGSMVPTDATGILLNSNSQFQFNTDEPNDFTFTFDNDNPSFVIDRNTAVNNETLVSVLSDDTIDASVALLALTKAKPIPITQLIGSVSYRAYDSAGSGPFEYTSLDGQISDSSAGAIDGELRINATLNNSITPFLIINNGGEGTIKAFRDLDMNELDILQIDRATFVESEGVITASDVTQMVLNSTGSFQTNTATGNDFVWTIDNDTIATFGTEFDFTIGGTNIANIQVNTTGGNNGVLKVRSQDFTGGAFIDIERNDISGSIPSPIIIGSYSFSAGTSVASTIAEYASIVGIVEDPSSGDFKASLDFNVAEGGGAQTTYFSLNDGEDEKIKTFKNLFLEAPMELNSNRLYTDEESVDSFIVGVGDTIQFYVDNAISPKIILTDDLFFLADDYPLNSQIVQHRGNSFDPSTDDGSIWYNSTTEKLRGREGGINFDLNSGSSGGLEAGRVIVAANEQENDTTTLTASNELKFIPTANTVYYIEVNAKYIIPSTRIVFGLQAGSDALYQIVQQAYDSAPANKYSTPGASNTRTVDFINSNGVGDDDDSSANFYIVLEVNNDIDEVALTFSKNTSTGSGAILQRGSMVRIYIEGDSDGGGGDHEFIDVAISNTASSIDDGYDDVDRKWFGLPQYEENIGVSLGSVNPGAPIRTFTVVSSGFGSGIPGANFETWGVMVSWNCQRPASGGADTRIFSQMYVNGSPIDVAELSTGMVISNDGSMRGAIVTYEVDLEVGDEVGIALWEQTSSNVTLENWAMTPMPHEWNVDNIRFIANTNPIGSDSGNDRNIMTAIPPGSSVIQWSAGGFSNFRIDKLSPPDSTYWPPDRDYVAVMTGSKFDIGDDITSNFAFGSFAGNPNTIIDIPQQFAFNFYRYGP